MREFARIIILAAVVAICGCATQPTTPIPPITTSSTGVWDPGQFVWADLLTDDVAAASEFYAAVFGWRFETTDDDEYVQATHNGEPVAGIAYHVNPDQEAREVLWLVSVSVDDVDSAVIAAVDAGGKLLEAARDVPGRGRFAVIADNEGAPLVMLKADGGDPAMRRTVDNEWIWAELWATNPDGSAQFYESALQFKAHKVSDPGGDDYIVLVRNGKPKAGIVKLPWNDVQPNWLPYLRVADVADSIERIRSAGGDLLVEPSNEYDEGRVAIVSDPTGGVFAIQARRSDR